MISAIILTKNEKENIEACIHSLLWCDEIIIIDDYSTDGTLKKVKDINRKKINTYQRAMNNDFSQQRNFGLQKAKGEWILFVDADERVTSSLQYEVLNIINTNIDNYVGYFIKRVDVMWGRTLHYGETAHIKLLRLMRKDAGEWKGRVHEKLEVDGKVGILRNPLMHYPHQSLTEFLKEINFYTDIRAQDLYRQKKKVNFLTIILYPFGKFIFNYIVRLGFRDRVPGLVIALMMSLHSFLVRGKLWQLHQHKSVRKP